MRALALIAVLSACTDRVLVDIPSNEGTEILLIGNEEPRARFVVDVAAPYPIELELQEGDEIEAWILEESIAELEIEAGPAALDVGRPAGEVASLLGVWRLNEGTWQLSGTSRWADLVLLPPKCPALGPVALETEGQLVVDQPAPLMVRETGSVLSVATASASRASLFRDVTHERGIVPFEPSEPLLIYNGFPGHDGRPRFIAEREQTGTGAGIFAIDAADQVELISSWPGVSVSFPEWGAANADGVMMVLAIDGSLSRIEAGEWTLEHDQFRRCTMMCDRPECLVDLCEESYQKLVAVGGTDEWLVIDPLGEGVHRFIPGDPGRLGKLTQELSAGTNDRFTVVTDIPGLGSFAGTRTGKLLRYVDEEWVVADENGIGFISSIHPFREGVVVSGISGRLQFYEKHLIGCPSPDARGYNMYSVEPLGDGVALSGTLQAEKRLFVVGTAK